MRTPYIAIAESCVQLPPWLLCGFDDRRKNLSLLFLDGLEEGKAVDCTIDGSKQDVAAVPPPGDPWLLAWGHKAVRCGTARRRWESRGGWRYFREHIEENGRRQEGLVDWSNFDTTTVQWYASRLDPNGADPQAIISEQLLDGPYQIEPHGEVMRVPSSVRWFWDEFSASVGGADEVKFYQSVPFGDSEELADELAALVLSGKKRATASSVWSYEAEGVELPAAGNLSILTDWSGEPLCVLKTTSVEVVPFNEVTAEFAAAEGEGDASLRSWREGHLAFFTRECEQIGTVFEESMPVCCERFEVVFVRRSASEA